MKKLLEDDDFQVFFIYFARLAYLIKTYTILYIKSQRRDKYETY